MLEGQAEVIKCRKDKKKAMLETFLNGILIYGMLIECMLV